MSCFKALSFYLISNITIDQQKYSKHNSVKKKGQQVALKKALLAWGSLKCEPDFRAWAQTGRWMGSAGEVSPSWTIQSTVDLPPNISPPVHLPGGGGNVLHVCCPCCP